MAGGEDVLDGVEAARAEGDGTGAGGVEPVVAVLPPQPHDPEHGPVSLLWVGAALEDSGDELTGRRSNLLGPPDEARRRPLGVRAMGAGHVLDHGGRLSVVAPPVRGHAAALEEDLDGRCVVTDRASQSCRAAFRAMSGYALRRASCSMQVSAERVKNSDRDVLARFAAKSISARACSGIVTLRRVALFEELGVWRSTSTKPIRAPARSAVRARYSGPPRARGWRSSPRDAM